MKITDFFELFFLKMGTSPKSSVFAQVGSRTSTQQRGSATGWYNGDHNMEAQRRKQNGKQQRNIKSEKNKQKTYFLFYLVALI